MVAYSTGVSKSSSTWRFDSLLWNDYIDAVFSNILHRWCFPPVSFTDLGDAKNVRSHVSRCCSSRRSQLQTSSASVSVSTSMTLHREALEKKCYWAGKQSYYFAEKFPVMVLSASDGSGASLCRKLRSSIDSSAAEACKASSVFTHVRHFSRGKWHAGCCQFLSLALHVNFQSQISVVLGIRAKTLCLPWFSASTVQRWYQQTVSS